MVFHKERSLAELALASRAHTASPSSLGVLAVNAAFTTRREGAKNFPQWQSFW